jgi:hypothetical protein
MTFHLTLPREQQPPAADIGSIVMKWTIGADGLWHRMPFYRVGNTDRRVAETQPAKETA